MVDCFANYPTTCIFFIAYSSSGMGLKNSSTIDPIEEDGNNETWIYIGLTMLLCTHNEEGGRYDDKFWMSSSGFHLVSHSIPLSKS